MLGVKDLKILPAKGEEKAADGLSPAELVMGLASHKAHEVAALCEKEDVILAADTIVWMGDEALGKPASPDDASRMLHELSGRTHHVSTGVCVLFQDQVQRSPVMPRGGQGQSDVLRHRNRLPGWASGSRGLPM